MAKNPASHRKPVSKRKIHILRVMLDRDQLQQLAAAATLDGMPVSTWVRLQALREAKLVRARTAKQEERATLAKTSLEVE